MIATALRASAAVRRGRCPRASPGGSDRRRRHLLRRLGQDRVELLLLLGAEPEAGHEPLPHLTRRATGAGAVAAGRRSGARRAALTARGPRRTGVGAGGPEAQRRVRHL